MGVFRDCSIFGYPQTWMRLTNRFLTRSQVNLACFSRSVCSAEKRELDFAQRAHRLSHTLIRRCRLLFLCDLSICVYGNTDRYGQQMTEVFRSVDGVLMLCQYDSEQLCKQNINCITWTEQSPLSVFGAMQMAQCLYGQLQGQVQGEEQGQGQGSIIFAIAPFALRRIQKANRVRNACIQFQY